MGIYPVVSLRKENIPVEFNLFIYLQLITWETEVDNGKVYSYYKDAEELSEDYPYLQFKDIKTALEELSEQGYIDITKKGILIAHKAARNGLVFLAEAETAKKDINSTLQLLDGIYEEAKGSVASSHVRRGLSSTYEKCKVLIEDSSQNNVYTISDLFRELYQMVALEPARVHTGKERGLIKHLLTTYNAQELKRMMVLYFSNPDKYSKKEISVVSLNFAKDALRRDLQRSKTKNEIYNEEKQTRRGFK